MDIKRAHLLCFLFMVSQLNRTLTTALAFLSPHVPEKHHTELGTVEEGWWAEFMGLSALVLSQPFRTLPQIRLSTFKRIFFNLLPVKIPASEEWVDIKV